MLWLGLIVPFDRNVLQQCACSHYQRRQRMLGSFLVTFLVEVRPVLLCSDLSAEQSQVELPLDVQRLTEQLGIGWLMLRLLATPTKHWMLESFYLRGMELRIVVAEGMAA
jgi:hypothetical protein